MSIIGKTFQWLQECSAEKSLTMTSARAATRRESSPPFGNVKYALEVFSAAGIQLCKGSYRDSAMSYPQISQITQNKGIRNLGFTDLARSSPQVGTSADYKRPVQIGFSFLCNL